MPIEDTHTHTHTHSPYHTIRNVHTTADQYIYHASQHYALHGLLGSFIFMSDEAKWQDQYPHQILKWQDKKGLPTLL